LPLIATAAAARICICDARRRSDSAWRRTCSVFLNSSTKTMTLVLSTAGTTGVWM
jgi:hypothetical protein